jgi:hypothetical protein
MSINLASQRGLLRSKAETPENVVFRSFAEETVVLNLKTEKYHSLNKTGGRMLEMLLQSPTVEAASDALAIEYDRPREQMAKDLCDFCLALNERELVELRPGS